jgi:hypothetical protein
VVHGHNNNVKQNLPEQILQVYWPILFGAWHCTFVVHLDIPNWMQIHRVDETDFLCFRQRLEECWRPVGWCPNERVDRVRESERVWLLLRWMQKWVLRGMR